MKNISPEAIDLLHESAFQIGILASYCEKTEHLEDRENLGFAKAPEIIRNVGATVLVELGLDPFIEYLDKIDRIEENNFYSKIDENSPRFAQDLDPGTVTWKEIQDMQQQHDRYFHPDVIGPGSLYHLNHTVLHLAKCSGYILGSLGKSSFDEVGKPRLTDLMIFGVKASTALHLDLPDNLDITVS